MSPEASRTFRCFGATCGVIVAGDGRRGTASEAVARAQGALQRWHDRFSRFIPDSELSRLNADPRAEVPVSALMGRFVEVVRAAGLWTGGLVDATLLEDIEGAGYRGDLGSRLPLRLALRLAAAPRPAAPSPAARWRDVAYDPDEGVVLRPPGLGLDSGGLAKGLFADVLGDALADREAYAVDCAGDLRLGGVAGLARPVAVQSPFDERTLHTYELAAGGVATSGIGRRSWLDARGRPAHHLLDPATGRPAFTGVVQVTALAPTALDAEIRAKAAVLSGPERAAEWLPDGGVVVAGDGGVQVVPAATAPEPRESAAARPARSDRGRPSGPSAGTAPDAAAADGR